MTGIALYVFNLSIFMQLLNGVHYFVFNCAYQMKREKNQAKHAQFMHFPVACCMQFTFCSIAS